MEENKIKNEISDEEIEKMIEKLKKQMSEEDFNELMDEIENMDDDDFDISDFVGKKDDKEKDIKESYMFNVNNILEGTMKIKSGERGIIGSAGNVVGGAVIRGIRRCASTAWSAGIKANPIGAVATIVKMKRTRNNMAYLQKQADDAKDPKEKQKLLDQKKAIMLSSFSSDGSYIIDPIQRRSRIKKLQADGKINSEIDLSDEALDELNKEGKEFGKTKEGRKYKKEQRRKLMKSRWFQKLGFTGVEDTLDDIDSEENYHKSKNQKEKKEEVVKDKDGSEIHARSKKTGNGATYVRTKNGKEVGYASKEEFQNAKKKNESYSGLSNFLKESLS